MGAPDLHDTFKNSDLRKALDCIERHRANLEHEGIQVPGICVAGSQSAGKSSVLESISGIAFPRGDTMCTRCPSVLSLECDDSVDEPKVVLATDPSYEDNRMECSIPEVGTHIKALTDILTPNGMVSRKPIYIKVTMRDCPTLTLTDLPGITCNSKFQENIEEETVALTAEYMSNKATIMLVVIPGSEDFNNPKALRLAKNYDPDGVRTIGVVTKVDGLLPDSDILEKMNMSRDGDVRVEQGFIAVRNRLKEETELSAESVREKERQLFTNDAKLSQLSPSQWGIGTLTQKIVDLQTDLVGNFTPEIKATLRKKIAMAQKELNGLEQAYVTDEERSGKFSSLIYQLTGNFEDSVCGRYFSFDGEDNDPSMNLSARSCELFEKFAANVEKQLPKFLEDPFKQQLDAIIKETRGVDLENFMSGSVFKGLVSKAFTSPLASHSESLKHEVHNLVHNLFSTLAEKLCVDFPKMHGYILEVVETILDEQMNCVSSALNILLKAERNHVYTQNHYYMDTITKFRRILDLTRTHETVIQSGMHSGQLDHLDELDLSGMEAEGISPDFISSSSQELASGASNHNQGIREMQVSLHVYSKVVRKRVFDVIPMVIRDALIANVGAELAMKLISRSTSDPDFLNHAMSQDPETMRARERKILALNSMKRALDDFMKLRC